MKDSADRFPNEVFISIANEGEQGEFLDTQTALLNFDFEGGEKQVARYTLADIKTYKTEIIECPTHQRKKKKAKK